LGKSIKIPIEYTREQLEEAVRLLKTENLAVWQRWCQHEMNTEALSDIADELQAAWCKLPFVTSLVHSTELTRQVRRMIRLELGLWV
jgi:hypothetical protein